MQQCMRLGLADAGLAPEAIGYISAHATATESGDLARARRPMRFSGKGCGERAQELFRPYPGRLRGAGGLACDRDVKPRLVCATMNLENVDLKCAALDYIRGDGREMQCEYVMSNNFALGGNQHLADHEALALNAGALIPCFSTSSASVRAGRG